MRNPKRFKANSKNNSQPRGGGTPTSKSVPKSNKKDLVVSLKL
jgi:hypothetical protein